MSDEELGRSEREDNFPSQAEGQEESVKEPKPYTGPDRRVRQDIREEIGEDKVLDKKQRKNVLERLKNGLFRRRKNEVLRDALGGEETVYSEEDRASILHVVTTSIRKFIKAGIDRPQEEERKKKRFTELVQRQQRDRETQRDHGRER